MIEEPKMKRTLRRLLPIAMISTMAVAAPQAAFADEPLPEYAACPGFAVTVESSGGNQDIRMTRVKDGILHTVIAGRGTTLTVTNAESKESVTFRTKGSVTRTAQDVESGTIDHALSGANLVLLFEGVDLGGPSTVLYTGLIRFTTDSEYTLSEPMRQVSGTQRDICSELS